MKHRLRMQNRSDYSRTSGRLQIQFPRFVLTIALLALTQAMLPLSLALGECVDYDSYYHWLDTVRPDGHPYRVAINGATGFVAAEEGGLSILDLSDPAAITVTSVLPDMYASDVTAVGSFAYVADWGTGLRVVDVSNPATPEIVGTCALANIASVTIADGYAYVTEPVLQTFYVIDISIPTAPSIVAGLYMQGFPWDTAVQDGFAYVSCSYAGVAVVDIAEPKDPIAIDMIDTPGVAFGVATDQKYAYVADGEAGLTVIKIEDPHNAIVVGNLDTIGAQDVKVSDSHVIVSDLSSGVLLFDVSVPELPWIAGSHTVYYRADGLAVEGSLLLVADGSAVIALDLAENPEPVPTIGRITEDYNVRGIDVRGQYAYAARYNGGIQVIDISDPSVPTVVSTTPAAGNSHAIELDASGTQTAQAAGDAGLQLFDVANPGHPVLLGSVTTPGYAWDVERSGSFVYVGDGAGGVQVIQTSNPAAPVRVGTLNLPGAGWCMHIALSGDYLYAADHHAGLFVLDVSDPTLPVSVRDVPIPGGGVGVVLAGNYAYVSSDSSLWTVDISDPSSAFLVGRVRLPDKGGDLIEHAGVLYVSTEYWGVYAFDIEDPTSPRILGGVFAPAYPDGITVADGRVFVVTQSCFVILPTHCAPAVGVPDEVRTDIARGGSMRISPNPSRGETVLSFELLSAGDARIEVLDVAGRRVRELAIDGFAIGPHRVVWNGRDDRGRRLPGGAYFVRLSQEGRSTVERLVLAR